jgi:hypothetical protein
VVKVGVGQGLGVPRGRVAEVGDLAITTVVEQQLRAQLGVGANAAYLKQRTIFRSLGINTLLDDKITSACCCRS